MDEILGPINEVFFTVKMDPGMVASSFKAEDKVFIGGDRLLPIERFLPKPKVPKAPGKKKSGAQRGGFGGGRGAPRGRGGFAPRGGRGGFGAPRGGRGGFGGPRGGRGGGFGARGGGRGGFRGGRGGY